MPQYQPEGDHPFDHMEDPYPWYDLIRQPPFFNQAYGAWLVSRYEDIRWVLERPDLFSAKDTMNPPRQPDDTLLAILAEGYPPVPAVLNRDGPSHRSMRSLVEKAILPWLKGKRAILQRQADTLVDAFLADGHAEVMDQFALPLTFEALCGLLGIPVEDRPVFQHHCNETLDLFASLNSSISLPEERQVACARSFVRLQYFLGDLAQQRKRLPQDDVISMLAQARSSGGSALAAEELVAVLIDLLLGGYKTTAGLIGSCVQHLLESPGAWQQLQTHPEQIPLAVEEVLRYDAPVQAMVRTATQTVFLPGASAPVAPETRVLLLFGAANHDPEAFLQADMLHLARKPNHHLGFGHGIHFCVGAPLARLEAQVAVDTLTRRLPHPQLTPGQKLGHIPTLLYRSPESVEITWVVAPEGKNESRQRPHA